jgi:hypothetical protein
VQPSQDKVLKLLFRTKSDSGVGSELESYLDRLLIRVYSSTSLIVYLFDAKINADGEVELVFNELPPEIVDKVIQLIGAEQTKVFTFRDEATNHVYHGFRSKPQQTALDEL